MVQLSPTLSLVIIFAASNWKLSESQLGFESVLESEEDEIRSNQVYVPCPPTCLCFQGTVRCMFLQLQFIPAVSTDTTTLDLRFNRIREIPQNAFQGLNDLHTLILNDNGIIGLENGIFGGLAKMESVFLNKNRIRYIHPETFAPLKRLRHLYLHYNEITEFHYSTFSNLHSLERLFLHHNRIQRIPPGAFENLHNLTRLRLDSNALICDCGILEFAQMLVSHPKTQAAATCQNPNPLHGRQVRDLLRMNLRCREPVIKEGPKDVEVNFGSTVYFACKAEGDPAPKIVWLHNENEISLSSEPRYSILDDGTLMIAKAEENDAGTFECMAKSSVGEVKSRKASMETKKREKPKSQPRFRQVPRDVDLKQGDSLTLNCSATGHPPPIITWSLNEVPIQFQNETRKRITAQGTLLIESTRKEDAGIYQCDAVNELRRISYIAKVTVISPPVWILSPLDQSVQKGNMLSLHCEASGEPSPSISWTHNGRPLSPDGHRVVLMQNGAQLVIKVTIQEDEGEFGCRVENGGGFLEEVANIRVIAGSPPLFTMRSIYTNSSTESDSSRTFKCSASGIPPPSILWRKDGFPISENSRLSILPGGTLIIHSFNEDLDSGIYACSAFNDHGIIHSNSVHLDQDGVRLVENDRQHLDDSVVFNAISQAKREISQAESDSLESLFGNASQAEIRSPFDLFRLARFPKAEARNFARSAEVYERALHLISKHAEKMEFNVGAEFSYNELLSPPQLELLSRFSGCIPHQKSRSNCSLEMCFHSRYRTIDGACNNLGEPMWGTSYTPFLRLLKPVYENGFNLPIGWTFGKLYNGHPMPLARSISSQIVRTNGVSLDDSITHMVMQWGQFLDHDLDHTLPSLSIESYGERISCRRTCANVSPCFPMQTPVGDTRVRTRKCMEFTRSASVCGSGITSIMTESIQQRQQVNQLTSFIDASHVYGSSVSELESLQDGRKRAFLRKGIYILPNKPLMPFATDETPVDCRRNLRESDIGCFLGGDIRVNEQLGLLAMHTVWFRQHNFLAEELKRLNPHWLDEVVFQEARKIVGAQMQHITYSHWLPSVIGQKGMEELGDYQNYDPNVNPTISTEFATAAFRFGHTIVNPLLRRLDANFESIPEGDLPLRQAFFSPWRLVEEGGLDPLLRGLFFTPAKLKRPNELLNSHLTEELFTHAHLVALDLGAMNIQRGRDHGLPSYNEYRALCNLSRANSFEDLKNEISDRELRSKLAEMYKDVNNVDLWVGGIAEDSDGEGARVGPTFRCIIVEQFKRLRDGDRFWYENPSVFRPEQLVQIKQSTLSRVLCDGGDTLSHVKRNVFHLASPLLPCSQIPSPQLGFWAESENCCDDKSRHTCALLSKGKRRGRRRGRRNSEHQMKKGRLWSTNATEVLLTLVKSLQKKVSQLETQLQANTTQLI